MARKTKQEAPAVAIAPATEAAAPDREQRDEAATLRDLNDAQALRQQLLLDGGDDGALDALEAEIAGHKKKLARYAEQKKLRAAANTKDAKAARRARTRDQLQTALDDARHLGEQSKDLLVHIVELGARLSSIAEKRAAIRANIIEHVAADQLRAVDSAIAALTLPDAVLRRLWSAGLGRTGVALDPSYLHVKPLGAYFRESDPDDEVATAVATIKRLASAALSAKEAA